MARNLLKAAALTAGTMLTGCGSAVTDTEPIGMPGNPKGSHYDDAATDGVDDTEAKPDDAVDDAEVKPDDDAEVKPDDAEDTEAKPETPPMKRPPPPPPEPTKIEPIKRPGNPKGSRYDDKSIGETTK